MTIYKNKKLCTGCTACMNVCPKKAITMLKDKEGFLYPNIDKKKCIECGLCVKTCPIINQISKNNNNKKVYGVKIKDNDVREKSTSGGFFTAISDLVFKEKGVVYGAIFDENIEVKHVRATNKVERNKMRGSKYVQSKLEYLFTDIKKDLNNRKKVLFVGTPCQIAGLFKYLKKEYDNLITCDVLCHGVTSPQIFNDHIKYLQKKYGKIKYYNFRDKKISWSGGNVTIKTKKQKIMSNTPQIRTHIEMYGDGYITRPSCHSCMFTTLDRITDFTIGDFWGVEKSYPGFNDNKGINLLFVNTIKGQIYFEKIINKFEIIECSDVNSYIQPQLTEPSKPNINRKSFWDDYYKKGYKYVVRKYIFKNNPRTIIKCIIPYNLIKIILKIKKRKEKKNEYI